MISRRIEILRLDYLFAVIVPTLFAIYFNKLDIHDYWGLIVSFCFFGISGNIINDIIDRKDDSDIEAQTRTHGFHDKELWALALVSGILGISLLIPIIIIFPLVAVYSIIAIILVLIYCAKKKIPVLNQFLLAISHIIIPYLIVKTMGRSFFPIISLGEGFFLAALLFFAVSGQTVHEIIDGDAITKYSLKTQQLVVIITSSVSIILGITGVILLKEYLLFSFILIPLGTIYSFRRPKKSRKSIKDTGILMGNLAMVFLFTIIMFY